MIGILDSGLGGLSTLSALRQLCPKADLLYLADQAHAPYGEHSESELSGYFESALDFFEEKRVEALLLACGTLSTVALPQTKKKTSFPIFEVTAPAVKMAAAQSKSGVAVLATTASIRSSVYAKRLYHEGVTLVRELACPLFVPLLEEGFSGDSLVAKEIARHYLLPLKSTPCDVLLLGCTHYGFLSPAIREIWPSVALVDCGKALAHHALTQFTPLEGQGRTLYYTTGRPDTFLKKASALLSLPHLTVYGTEGEKQRD